MPDETPRIKGGQRDGWLNQSATRLLFDAHVEHTFGRARITLHESPDLGHLGGVILDIHQCGDVTGFNPVIETWMTSGAKSDICVTSEGVRIHLGGEMESHAVLGLLKKLMALVPDHESMSGDYLHSQASIVVDVDHLTPERVRGLTQWERLESDLPGDPEPKIDLAEYVAAHLSYMGACSDTDPDSDSDPEGDDSLCKAVSCTYCQMARALQPEVCGPPLGTT